MEVSKKDIGKIVRGATHGKIQLERVEENSSPEKNILCNIIVNGLPQEGYSCCCICKKLLKNGAANKSCRNKHISKHYWKGDLLGTRSLAQLIETFNLFHRRT